MPPNPPSIGLTFRFLDFHSIPPLLYRSVWNFYMGKFGLLFFFSFLLQGKFFLSLSLLAAVPRLSDGEVCFSVLVGCVFIRVKMMKFVFLLAVAGEPGRHFGGPGETRRGRGAAASTAQVCPPSPPGSQLDALLFGGQDPERSAPVDKWLSSQRSGPWRNAERKKRRKKTRSGPC